MVLLQDAEKAAWKRVIELMDEVLSDMELEAFNAKTM